MAKILGLDLGTNSLGWAITEQLDDSYRLLDHGVNIFQEGVAREKGIERPMVQERTKARASRRHYFRRRLRKIELLKVLIANEMCPYLSNEDLDAWRYSKQYPLDEEFLAWLRTNEEENKNPYHDRYLALTTTLDLSKRSDRYTFGRALYHLTQRRGFLSNRKDSASNDDGVVTGAIKRLDEDMQDAAAPISANFTTNYTSTMRRFVLAMVMAMLDASLIMRRSLGPFATSKTSLTNYAKHYIAPYSSNDHLNHRRV